ncbi:hypothetical protein EC957_005685 [Mortierella hygrophila]|uniref:SLC26A/SulP transporter domain-containing protein n=1 Tax=Mortierella hygrophila TaxID=979708 RepID=A0A9P6FE15_9FUNG|nr:hypothetical protein EC957_005685 [Mortierella hygrophila]
MPMPDHNRGRNHDNSYGSFPSSSAVDNSSSTPAHSTPTTQPAPQQQRTAPSSLSSLQHSSSTASCHNTNANNNNNNNRKKNNTNTPPIGRDQSPASFRSSGSSLSCSSLPRGVNNNDNNNNNNNSSTSGLLPKDQPWQSKVKAGSTAVGQFMRRRIPILSWLVSNPGYNWKNDLTQDLFAGVTISAVIIPQSMAYAMLASLPAVHGLYTSLVPTALYAVLGTSKHMSTGTFAITSLLLGQFAHKVLSDQGFVDDVLPDGEYQRRYLPTCLMLTAVVGGVQILLSMARLGRWTSRHLLPTALVSGFNTASAFHIGTHQLRHWLGMKPPQEGGVFGMIRTWIWIVQHFWQDTVWPSLAMGLAAMIFMYILQRIEYWRRRSDTDLVPLYSSSPAPSVALASPSVPGHPSVLSYSAPNSGSSYSQQAFRPSSNGSTQTTDRPNSQRLPRVTSNTRRPGQNRESVIVPRAVSDQALLTAQDVALQAPCLDYDSCSPGCSPNFGPNLHEDQPALPNLKLPTPFSPPNSHSGADGARLVLILPSGSTSPQPHSPTSPRVAGLTNTGAVGHRHDRGSRSHKPSPKVRRYKTFRSTTPSPPTSRGPQHHPQPHLQNHQQQQQQKQRGSMDLLNDEREPLLSVNNGGNGAGTASETEEGYASSSASSTRYARTRGYYPEHLQELQRTESTQQPYWRICIPQVHLPIPDIFICVVVFTVATVIFNLDTEYGIGVIGMIPTGLPMMAWPGAYIGAWSIQDWVPLLWPGILMAIVVYVMSLSVAKHFGREYGYEIDADQEMLALGVSSLVGSCFGGYACTGNLTRSAILAQLGAKTPLSSLVGAFMVLMSLLWFTVLFERIPNTVLAAIVLVALKSLFAHTVEVKRLWRVGRRKEALIWWTTFISVIVFSIEIGLAVGISLVVVLKLYKHGKKWKRVAGRYIRHSATYQRIMLMLGLHSPLFTTAGRGLYTNDDEDDY